MAQAQAEGQAARNAAIVALALHELQPLWAQVDWKSSHAAEAVKAIYGSVVTRFGQAAATVAAEAFDDVRAERNLTSRFRATPADPVPNNVIVRVVDSAFLGNADHVRVTETAEPTGDHVHVAETTSDLPVEQRVPIRLEDSLQRHVLQPARDTIAENAAADPAKPTYIRVPKGATTCAFCVMLASRELGPNFTGYQTRENALFRKNGGKYHKHCDCEAIAVYPGDNQLILSPHLLDYQDMYYKATADAGTHRDAKKILASMRKLHGLK